MLMCNKEAGATELHFFLKNQFSNLVFPHQTGFSKRILHMKKNSNPNSRLRMYISLILNEIYP